MILNKDEGIKELEKLLREGSITPAERVDEDSLVCLLESTSMAGVQVFRPLYLGTLPASARKVLLGLTKGDVVGPYRLIGVYDVWDNESKLNPKAKLVSKH